MMKETGRIEVVARDIATARSFIRELIEYIDNLERNPHYPVNEPFHCIFREEIRTKKD